jgi:hypothetical protein
MLLPILIRYVQLIAKRRGSVDIPLAAMIAVVALTMCLLIFKSASDAAPREEIQIALLR